MRPLLLNYCLLAVVALTFIPAGYSQDGGQIQIKVNPDEPTNFQPTYKGETRALITIQAVDYPSGVTDAGVLRLRITHLKGKGLINTGYPHMEGKVVFDGNLPLQGDSATMEYVFPIRGNYLLEAELFDVPTRREIGSGKMKIHVKEPFFQTRNSVILLTLLFVFGLYLGRIYGGATMEVAK